MAKSRKVKKVHICETCHGNGYVRVAVKVMDMTQRRVYRIYTREKIWTEDER